jgi:hypothetical protein
VLAAALGVAAAAVGVAVIEHRRAVRLERARRELHSRIHHLRPTADRRWDSEFPGCRW